MPGAPLSAETAMPESSASAGTPAAWAAASALSSALAMKVRPVSSGSGSPRSPAELTFAPKGASSSTISRSLPGLCVATISSPPSKRRAMALKARYGRALQPRQLGDALACQAQQLGELLLGEGRLFGRGLDLDQLAGSGQH